MDVPRSDESGTTIDWRLRGVRGVRGDDLDLSAVEPNPEQIHWVDDIHS
jgi:hypothetical protein